MATHSSILDWRIPRTEESGWLQSKRSQRVRHDLGTDQQEGKKQSWPIETGAFPQQHIWSISGLPSLCSAFYVFITFQFSSVTQSCPTLCDPMNRSAPGLPVHHQIPEFTRLTSIESVMPSSYLILCRPLFLLLQIPPSIRVFSNESLKYKGDEKASDIGIWRGQKECPLASVSSGVIYFPMNQKMSGGWKGLIRPTPIIYILRLQD